MKEKTVPVQWTTEAPALQVTEALVHQHTWIRRVNFYDWLERWFCYEEKNGCSFD